MEILLHYSICIDVFFFCVHVPLSVYFLLSPSVVFSATVSIPNVYIGSSHSVLTSIIREILYNKYFYDPF